MAAIEGVFGGEPEVVVEKIGHGAAVKPAAVEFPLAAGIQQAISDEGQNSVFDLKGATLSSK